MICLAHSHLPTVREKVTLLQSSLGKPTRKMKTTFILLVLAVGSIKSSEVTTLPAVTSVTQEYVNYGEPCSKSTDCDSSAYLSCVNGSCQCVLSEAMRFDDASSSCWVLPGEKCIYRAAEVGLSIMVEATVGEERTIRGDRLSVRCVSNSACEDGFCNCDSGYFPTLNGTCERQHEYGETCKSDEACRSSLHLICNDGSCGCNQSNSVFDVEHGICVGLSGSSCFDFEMCTTDAYCPSFGIFNQYDVKCTCKPGYFETANRTCVSKVDYGAPCVSNQECRDDLNLVCSSNKCICNSTTHLYDTSEGKCLALIGSPCSEQTPCVSNADCQHAGFLNGNVLARNMICRCGYGHFENEKKVCEKKREFDIECKENNQCRDDLKLTCNKSTGLCACNETIHTYDRSKRRCISLSGSHCERNEHCVINSICRSPGYLYPRHTPKAECICKDGFVRTKQGFCLGKYGSRCESWTNSCKDGLTCRAGECTCKFGIHQQYYDYTSETCATYIGAPCSGANDTSCILNGHCTSVDGTTHVCKCKDGFVPMDGGKRCAALVGEKCSEGEHGYYIPCVPHAKCDQGFCKCALDYYSTSNRTCDRKRAYGELCVASENCADSFCEIMGGYCSCNKSTSMFDATRKTCMRLAGAKCYDMRDCVPNALCRSPGRLNYVDKDATCSCKDGYYASSNGTCEWKRGYGETCTDSKECQDAADLYCSVHGRCECNTTISAFDETRKTCLRLSGSPCSSHQQCVTHAKCKNPLYWVHFETFSPHAKCECEEELGYSNHDDGRCMIDYYGGKCDIGLGQHCSSKFICEEGRCMCPYEDHQRYDHKTKSCISLVKGPCDNSTNLCTKNSHCIATEEGIYECRCKHGFIAVNRGCELTFGQTCSVRPSKSRLERLYITDASNVGAAAQDDEEPKCDRLAPLKCVHGTCQCGGFQFYDYEQQKCRGLVGSRCEPDVKGFCGEGSTCEAYRSFTEGSQDVATNSTSRKRYGRCKCMQGYVTEANRACARVL